MVQSVGPGDSACLAAVAVEQELRGVNGKVHHENKCSGARGLTSPVGVGLVRAVTSTLF